MFGEIAISLLLTFSTPPSQTPDMELVGEYTISAYTLYEGGGENETTASGVAPREYITVAASSDYPFGTVLYIEGIGEVRVEDRGGSLIESGERIDLFIGTDNAEEFGLQKRKVYLVK